MRKIKKLIGDKPFYRNLLFLVFPMIMQQGISSAVNLLDNVMVGALGTTAISAVAICSQVFFVFYITIFGGISGASIFSSQFHGRRDIEGVRATFRYKLLFGTIISIVAIFIFTFFGENIIGLYLNKNTTNLAEIATTTAFAKQYIKYMIWGIIPFVISQCFTTTLRETGNTFMAMVAGVLSMFVNLVLNYLLIFGKFGFPQMGVAGAALATVIARLVEVAFITLQTYHKRESNPFIIGAFRTLKVPIPILKAILIKGAPLLANEFLWALGPAAVIQSYSYRGVHVLAAMNISGTIAQLFNVFFFAMGNSVAILVGQDLGAGNLEKAKDTDRKIIAFNVFVTTFIGIALILAAPYVPNIYNIETSVRNLATSFLIIQGIALPIHAFNHCAYFTLRSGGQTVITFLFDSVFTCIISLPLAFIISRYTTISVVAMFAIVSSADLIKSTIGFFFLKSDIWVKSIVV